MSTAIADAARDAPQVRQKSGDADRAFDVLMGMPPWKRRALVPQFEPREMRQILASGLRQAGTPYALWVDDPIGFVEHVLGESMWSKQRQVVNAIPPLHADRRPRGHRHG